jgi:hypothetical protein
MNRQFLPDFLPTSGNSRRDHRQFLRSEPANFAQCAGRNCALSVSDQLPDQSSTIRVIFFEKDRASSMDQFISEGDDRLTPSNRCNSIPAVATTQAVNT